MYKFVPNNSLWCKKRQAQTEYYSVIVWYATKKFRIEYQGFLLRFCTHRNEFNCVFRSMKLRKYAIRSLIWSYASVTILVWMKLDLYQLFSIRTCINFGLAKILMKAYTCIRNRSLCCCLDWLPIIEKDDVHICTYPCSNILAYLHRNIAVLIDGWSNCTWRQQQSDRFKYKL